MMEWIDMRPDTRVQEREYRRLLGYPPGHEPGERVLALADEARHWYAAHGRPWVYVRETPQVAINGDNLQLNGVEFAAPAVCDQFRSAKAHAAALVIVSAGRECEEHARRLWQEGKPDEYFFLETYGSAVVEHLVTSAGGRICALSEPNGMAVLPHYSPGYSGWDVAQQNILWQAIRAGGIGALPGPITVLDSGMLQPKKSLLAIFGITRHVDRVRNLARLIPCENCSLPGCRYRRTPYQLPPPGIEDLRRLQGSRIADTPPLAGLDPNARYSVNARALRKWSVERLQLRVQSDRTVEAQFVYDGTTCANLGRPLQFHYHVKLSPPEDGYRIVACRCTPAPGDIGHQSMCEYLSDANGLMGAIAAEQPLVGQPLNAVLSWSRPFNPSGCYCDADRRAHKWGLVFEVLHFALARAAHPDAG